MIKVYSSNALVGACALTFPVMMLASLSAPGAMTAVTGAAVGIVLAGASWIVLSSWRDAQATENISHALNYAESRTPGRS